MNVSIKMEAFGLDTVHEKKPSLHLSFHEEEKQQENILWNLWLPVQSLMFIFWLNVCLFTEYADILMAC